MPSGLVPVGNLRGWVDEEEGSRSPRRPRPPYAQVGQRVYFCAEPRTDGGKVTLRYVARVITAGTYTWETAIAQSPFRPGPRRADGRDGHDRLTDQAAGVCLGGRRLAAVGVGSGRRRGRCRRRRRGRVGVGSRRRRRGRRRVRRRIRSGSASGSGAVCWRHRYSRRVSPLDLDLGRLGPADIAVVPRLVCVARDAGLALRVRHDEAVLPGIRLEPAPAFDLPQSE